MVRRRKQLLIHSYLYYERGTSLISDKQWDTWAKELQQLQNDNPALAWKGEFAEAFQGFTFVTGYNLPYRCSGIVDIAERLLKYHEQHKEEINDL